MSTDQTLLARFYGVYTI
jgi:catabolite regulation protein CreA